MLYQLFPKHAVATGEDFIWPQVWMSAILARIDRLGRCGVIYFSETNGYSRDGWIGGSPTYRLQNINFPLCVVIKRTQ